ncbi:hypothetical protein EBB07_01410 [Paenibacillaceae bacterium]|nr:hypothetical protein EBB07_01410 [Paenibacillaceae bacterium]
MQQVTISHVQDAVKQAIETAYPDIPVVNGEITEPAEPPRFFIGLAESRHTKELGRRFLQRSAFVIRLVSPEGESSLLYDAAEQLKETLGWIDVGGSPLPGTDMRFEAANHVLQFYVTYSMLLWEKAPDEPLMGSISQEGIVHAKQ